MRDWRRNGALPLSFNSVWVWADVFHVLHIFLGDHVALVRTGCGLEVWKDTRRSNDPNEPCSGSFVNLSASCVSLGHSFDKVRITPSGWGGSIICLLSHSEIMFVLEVTVTAVTGWLPKKESPTRCLVCYLRCWLVSPVSSVQSFRWLSMNASVFLLYQKLPLVFRDCRRFNESRQKVILSLEFKSLSAGNNIMYLQTKERSQK